MGQAGVGDIARRVGPWWGIQKGATRYPRARITRGGEQPDERADDGDETEEGDDASPKKEELRPDRCSAATDNGRPVHQCGCYLRGRLSAERRTGRGLREEEPVRLFFYLRATLRFYYFGAAATLRSFCACVGPGRQQPFPPP